MNATEKNQLPALPPDLLTRLRSLVVSRSGLYFRDHDLGNLAEGVAERMRALRIGSPVSYYNRLMTSEDREDELRELLNLLTINHTYFFRNEPQFKALERQILPEIIERKRRQAFAAGGGRPSIAIWSAGCSTGEEPYSIAMVLRDAIDDIAAWDIRIFATDVSAHAIDRARRGVYSAQSVKHAGKTYRDRYFTPSGSEHGSPLYAISDDIKKMVELGYFNLMEERYPGPFDVIFCRNVVIYFELETTIRVMEKFHASLAGDGYLFIGYSETLHHMPAKFRMAVSDDAVYYRKTGVSAGEAPRPATAVTADLDAIIDTIARAEVKADVESRPEPVTVKYEEMLTEAVKLSRLKRYDAALSLLDGAAAALREANEPHYLAAEILMNQGRIAEAKTRLATVIRRDNLFAPAYYLLGCLHIEERALAEAKGSLRRALYLEKDFILAHFYLATVFRDEGHVDEAIREYRNTLKLLSKVGSDGILPHSGGASAITLASMCRDNIERLKLEAWQ